MARNIVTSLRRRSALSMARFDALPHDLRAWLHEAALPWSVRSAQRLWARAMARHGGDVARALASMDRAEARTLARDLHVRRAGKVLEGAAQRSRKSA